MDFSAIEEAASGLDPASLTDPSKIEEILQQGAFEPQTTPEQKLALERLETMLALVEGWVEVVVAERDAHVASSAFGRTWNTSWSVPSDASAS